MGHSKHLRSKHYGRFFILGSNIVECFPSPSSIDRDGRGGGHSHTVLGSVVCPLPCVAGSVGLNVSIVI